MRIPTLLVAACLVLASSAARAQLPYEPRAEKDGYRTLFPDAPAAQAPSTDAEAQVQARIAAARDALRRASEALARTAPSKPIVRCGTLIIPADPTIDPKMRVAPPETGAEPAMRTITPPACPPPQ